MGESPAHAPTDSEWSRGTALRVVYPVWGSLGICKRPGHPARGRCVRTALPCAQPVLASQSGVGSADVHQPFLECGRVAIRVVLEQRFVLCFGKDDQSTVVLDTLVNGLSLRQAGHLVAATSEHPDRHGRWDIANRLH